MLTIKVLLQLIISISHNIESINKLYKPGYQMSLALPEQQFIFFGIDHIKYEQSIVRFLISLT